MGVANYAAGGGSGINICMRAGNNCVTKYKQQAHNLNQNNSQLFAVTI